MLSNRASLILELVQSAAPNCEDRPQEMIEWKYSHAVTHLSSFSERMGLRELAEEAADFDGLFFVTARELGTISDLYEGSEPIDTWEGTQQANALHRFDEAIQRLRTRLAELRQTGKLKDLQQDERSE